MLIIPIMYPENEKQRMDFLNDLLASGADRVLVDWCEIFCDDPQRQKTLDDLKKKGYWAVGADMDGQDYRTLNYDFNTVLIIGNEGKGISRLVREKCDVIVSLPMKGKINSLNASVAAGILMYEAMKDR